MEANNQSLTMDVKTCSRILGLSERSTYRLVEQSYRGNGKLRVLRFGTRWLIVKESVYQLVKGGGS